MNLIRVAIVCWVALILAGCGSGSVSGSASNTSNQPPGVSLITADATTPAGAGTTIGDDAPDTCPPPEVAATAPITAAQAIYDRINELPVNAPEVVQGPWKVQVVGDTSQGHILKIKASGFPANGYYKLDITSPDQTEYTYLCRNGRFDKDGGMPFWEWNHLKTNTGTADPPGVYTLKITDVTPGSPYVNVPITATFEVKEMRR